MLSDYSLIKPKAYPTQLLDKDWSNRLCTIKAGENQEEKQKIADLIHDLKVRDDDVWLVTFPKCGTTWMQELVWLVLHEFDFETAKNVPLEVRSPFVELTFQLENTLEDAVHFLNNLKSPRLLKTHKALPLLPCEVWHKKPKTIYVVRDPRDALVSAYHFRRSYGHNFEKSLDDVVLQELAHERTTQEFFNHMLEFYALRHEPWVFYTSFENMKMNLRQVILDVCKFLNKSINDEQMSEMLHHLSFEEMKKNPQVNHLWEREQLKKVINFPDTTKFEFLRKGEVGSHKAELSSEVVEKLNCWVQDALQARNLTMNEILLRN